MGLKAERRTFLHQEDTTPFTTRSGGQSQMMMSLAVLHGPVLSHTVRIQSKSKPLLYRTCCRDWAWPSELHTSVPPLIINHCGKRSVKMSITTGCAHGICVSIFLQPMTGSRPLPILTSLPSVRAKFYCWQQNLNPFRRAYCHFRAPRKRSLYFLAPFHPTTSYYFVEREVECALGNSQ